MAERVYHVDTEGYLLDENSYYLLNKEGQLIRITETQKELLQTYRLLLWLLNGKDYSHTIDKETMINIFNHSPFPMSLFTWFWLNSHCFSQNVLQLLRHLSSASITNMVIMLTEYLLNRTIYILFALPWQRNSRTRVAIVYWWAPLWLPPQILEPFIVHLVD